MRNRIQIAAWIIACTGLALAAVNAWAAGPSSIARALESVAVGQHFSVEGVVIERLGTGKFKIRDDSGVMPILIPETITRNQGVPKLNERIRVSGKFDQKKLDRSVQGMRVAYLERMGTVTGGRGASAPADSAVVPLETLVPPAALNSEASNVTMTRPTLGQDLVDRMRAERRAYEAAKINAEEAAAIYARAAYVAGKDAPVDPAVVSQLESAEAQVHEIQAGVPALSAAAREAGLEENLIGMFEQAMGLQ